RRRPAQRHRVGEQEPEHAAGARAAGELHPDQPRIARQDGTYGRASALGRYGLDPQDDRADEGARVAQDGRGRRRDAAPGGAMTATGPSASRGALLVSGKVITMDPAMPRAEAFGVRAGRIVSVGSRAEVRAALGSTAAEFHAERGAIIPGLIDSHNHMLWTGIQRLQADVSGCASIAELLEALRRFAETHPEREWIVSGSGWHIERLAEKRYPTRQELDSVSSTRPIYLPRVGHAAAANSEALRRAGIGRDTPDPPGGRIGRDAHGEPDGLLLEPP